MTPHPSVAASRRRDLGPDRCVCCDRDLAEEKRVNYFGRDYHQGTCNSCWFGHGCPKCRDQKDQEDYSD